jgi:hypothetical protein
MNFKHKNLDEAITDFWIRFENKPYTGGPLAWFGQSSIAIDYYLALSYAIDKDDKNSLLALLKTQNQPPEEFLPILAMLYEGKTSKGGPKPTFTYAEKVNLYFIMLARKKQTPGVQIEVIAENLYEDMKDLPHKLSATSLYNLWKELDPQLKGKLKVENP